MLDCVFLTEILPALRFRRDAPVTFPSVSVALATYNGAPYLAQQLGDLASQSHAPCELIVCDDGSTDDTLAVVRDFAASAPFPVQIHRNPARIGYRQNFIQCAGL